MNRRIVIIGGGESGTGAALLAAKQGFDVFLSDGGKLKPKYRETLQNAGIHFEEGMHSVDQILNAGEIVKSPGVPEKSPIMKEIRKAGIPVISEIEFAGRYTNARIVGITGTNGKTTTTSLVYHLFKKAGLNVRMGGNVGNSFAMEVCGHEGDCDVYVLELSSFQLDEIEKFRVHIAILTNITPDHLDRYGYDLEKYIDAKFRIAKNQLPEDAFIYCADDELTIQAMQTRSVKGTLYPFSIKSTEGMTAFVQDSKMIITYEQQNTDMLLTDLSLQGKHNLYNSMAAAVAARIMDIRDENIREALSDFEGIEHRLEHVAKVKGIEFINDSKATNVNSTWYALESMYQPVIWIVGGQDKGNDYAQLLPLVKDKVKAIICLGIDNSKIVEAFTGSVEEIIETQSMADAVKAGYYMGKTGDVVLLSPACASFDLFENYEDRGRQFKSSVREL